MATWKKVVVESSSNTIAQNTSGNSATVTTNANLTGHVTSSGNATTIANTRSAAPFLCSEVLMLYLC